MTVICPKCKNVIFVPENKDFVICCGEVIYVINTPIVQRIGQGFPKP
jgi:hypothetical protein